VLTERRVSLSAVPVRQRDALRPSLSELFSDGAPLRRTERDARVRSACSDWLYSRSEVARYLRVSHSVISRIVTK